MLMLRDLEDAEARYHAAAAELRKAQSHPGDSAYESLTRDGRRQLNVTNPDLERRDRLRDRLGRAERSLIATRQAWVRGE